MEINVEKLYWISQEVLSQLAPISPTPPPEPFKQTRTNHLNGIFEKTCVMKRFPPSSS